MRDYPALDPDTIPPLWSAILDCSYNGIVIINRSGVVVLYNEAARKLLGFQEKSPVGKRFSDLMPETWPDLKNVLDTGIPQIARRIALPQATLIANRNPIILEGQALGVISVFQDISEYEAIISELRGYKQLNRQLEAVIESSTDGLYLTDGNADTIRVNSAYERITGLDRRDLVGRNMRDLVREKVLDYSVTLAVLEQGKQVTLMQTVKGATQVMVTGVPVFDENGKIALVVTNVRDMTMLNELRSQLEESRRITTEYYKSLLELQQIEYALQDLVVKSPAMRQVVQKAVKVAGVDTSVLISGESGVGKSMLARTIHLMSSRKEYPFVKINCGAIPESLMESELFGYKKGAFTGASPEGKAGLIKAAHLGTVFLDEVGDLTLGMQVKLLQVIEEKSFTPIGGTMPTSVDVRIIAATNRDLRELVHRGAFREDLYYRLHVIPIHVPPLRERREDIAALVTNVMEKFRLSNGLHKRMEPEVLDHLIRYAFPGNVRELINLVERMIVMSEGPIITTADLPGELKETPHSALDRYTEGLSLKDAVAAAEARIIASAVQRWGGVSRAARALCVHPTTLWRKMVRLGFHDRTANKQGSCNVAIRPKMPGQI
jgi:PAS domain S-box-containing protein